MIEFCNIESLNQPLLSLSEYIKIQPPNVPIRKLEKYYSNYKLDHEQRKIETFFYEHRNEEWFLERYSPIFKCELSKHFTSQTVSSFNQFMIDMKKDMYQQIDLSISPELISLFKKQNGTGLNFHGQVDLPEKLNITNAPLFGFDPNSLTLFIKAVPKNISRMSLLKIFEKLPGFASLSLSDPLRSHDFVRYGWAAFRNEKVCAEGFLMAQPALQSELDLSLMRSKTAKRFFKVVPHFSLIHLKENLVFSAELIRLLDKLNGLTGNLVLPEKYFKNPSLESSKDDLDDLIRGVDLNSLFQDTKICPLKQFDLQISYLRKVHYFCYFSVTQFNDERKLSAKSGCAFLRPSLNLKKEVGTGKSLESSLLELSSLLSADDIKGLARQSIKKQTIISDWYFKLKVLLSKHLIHLSKTLQTSPLVCPEKPLSFYELEQAQSQIEGKVVKKVESKLKELSKNLWPCPFCDKCFKSSDFVLKHFHKKHLKQKSAIQKNILRKIMMRNYTTDDSKIVIFHETKQPGGNGN